MQYTPAIVMLQQQMYELSNRKLDIKEVTELKIKDYSDSLKGNVQQYTCPKNVRIIIE